MKKVSSVKKMFPCFAMDDQNYRLIVSRFQLPHTYKSVLGCGQQQSTFNRNIQRSDGPCVSRNFAEQRFVDQVVDAQVTGCVSSQQQVLIETSANARKTNLETKAREVKNLPFTKFLFFYTDSLIKSGKSHNQIQFLFVQMPNAEKVKRVRYDQLIRPLHSFRSAWHISPDVSESFSNGQSMNLAALTLCIHNLVD